MPATPVSIGELVGYEAVLNYNTGTHAVPVWVTITRAKDVSLNASKGMAEISSRISRFKFKKGALKELSLEFGYMYSKGTDSVWTMLNDSFVNGTAVEFWVGDATITLQGAKGWRFYGEVSDFSYEQALEDAETFNVKVEPTTSYDPITSALISPDVYIIP